MPVYALGDHVPSIDANAYVHPDAVVVGRVTIGPEANVWPTAVLRGDYGHIVVGARTSVQDGTVIHAGEDFDTVIAENCVIGHNAYLEGCRIDTECLVGSMACVLPYASLGRGAVVAAGAVVTRGSVVPERAMALGVPAKIIEGRAEDRDFGDGVQRYVDNAKRWARDLRRIDA